MFWTASINIYNKQKPQSPSGHINTYISSNYTYKENSTVLLATARVQSHSFIERGDKSPSSGYVLLYRDESVTGKSGNPDFFVLISRYEKD